MTFVYGRGHATRFAFALICAVMLIGVPVTRARGRTGEPRPEPVVAGPAPAPQVLAIAPDFDEWGAATARTVVAQGQRARIERLLRARETARRVRSRALEAARFRAEHRCPVDHPRVFAPDFGQQRGDHRHMGIDMVAPMGTPVRAPFSGAVVAFANPRGGLAVRLYGNGGHLYVAHLLRYGRLGRIRYGDAIGYVGNSGARGVVAHAHVEWHPANGRAVDPYRMLVALCGPRTPVDRRVALRMLLVTLD